MVRSGPKAGLAVADQFEDHRQARMCAAAWRDGQKGMGCMPDSNGRHAGSALTPPGAINPSSAPSPVTLTDRRIAKLVDWRELFAPLGRKVLDLLEIQDRGFALADDCCPLAFLGQQCH